MSIVAQWETAAAITTATTPSGVALDRVGGTVVSAARIVAAGNGPMSAAIVNTGGSNALTYAVYGYATLTAAFNTGAVVVAPTTLAASGTVNLGWDVQYPYYEIAVYDGGSHTTATVALNQLSSVGPAGATGPQGEQGEPGDAGAATSDDLTDVTLTSIADGDLLYRAGGVWVNKTTAQVQALVGGLVLIQRLPASNSASLDFVTGIDDTYDQYELHYGDILSANDNVAFNLTLSTDGGSTWASSAYRWVDERNRSASTGVAADGSDSASAIQLGGLGLGNNTGEACHGRIWFYNLRSTTRYKALSFQHGFWDQNGGVARVDGAGGWGSASAVNGIRIAMASGNITSGWAALYGVRKA